MSPSTVVSFVLVVALLIFVVQNGVSAHMHVVGLAFSVPLAVAPVMAAVTGALAGRILTAPGHRSRHRREIMRSGEHHRERGALAGVGRRARSVPRVPLHAHGPDTPRP